MGRTFRVGHDRVRVGCDQKNAAFSFRPRTCDTVRRRVLLSERCESAIRRVKDCERRSYDAYAYRRPRPRAPARAPNLALQRRTSLRPCELPLFVKRCRQKSLSLGHPLDGMATLLTPPTCAISYITRKQLI
ncbi:hypothetical protein MRX96_059493 [Rhipicephalus microplus]